MKYAHLLQIAEFFKQFKKINSVKRVADMVILICFDRQNFFFDLSKSDSAVYIDDEFVSVKEYNAPFDNIIKKRLNSALVTNFECMKNNRILKISCDLQGSYKSLKSILYLEFTGRFTNAILTDENGIILEALRHIDNSYRKIEVGTKLRELEAFEIKEKNVDKISDFYEFFKAEANRIKGKKFANLQAVKMGQIHKKIEILNKNLNDLEDKDELLQKSNELSKKATLLLANLSNLNDFDRNFNLTDFDGKDINFSLENSPKSSANKFFNSSKRLKAKAYGIEIEKENLIEKLYFLEKLESLLASTKNISELEILAPKKQNARLEKNESENVQNFYIREFKISVGKNENGNIFLLKNSKKDDIWMHLKDLPSPHIIIKTNKTKIDDEILSFAAKLCLNFSSVSNGKYEIDYTKRENVKIISGANVNYINFKTIIARK